MVLNKEAYCHPFPLPLPLPIEFLMEKNVLNLLGHVLIVIINLKKYFNGS